MEKIRLRAGALIIQNGAVLLVEYQNDNGSGVHYNLPGGGVEPGETLAEAVIREVREETSADVEVGPVAFVYEYQPAKTNYLYGDVHSVAITFACTIKDGGVPAMPAHPDPQQTHVKWIPVPELESIQLYPEITRDIMDYFTGQKYRNYVEEYEIQAGKR